MFSYLRYFYTFDLDDCTKFSKNIQIVIAIAFQDLDILELIRGENENAISEQDIEEIEYETILSNLQFSKNDITMVLKLALHELNFENPERVSWLRNQIQVDVCDSVTVNT
jgi:hypothetical protein